MRNGYGKEVAHDRIECRVKRYRVGIYPHPNIENFLIKFHDEIVLRH